MSLKQKPILISFLKIEGNKVGWNQNIMTDWLKVKRQASAMNEV